MLPSVHHALSDAARTITALEPALPNPFTVESASMVLLSPDVEGILIYEVVLR